MNAVAWAHERLMCSQGALRSDPSPAETKCTVVRCDLAAWALESHPKTPKRHEDMSGALFWGIRQLHSLDLPRFQFHTGHMGHMKAAMTCHDMLEQLILALSGFCARVRHLHDHLALFPAPKTSPWTAMQRTSHLPTVFHQECYLVT